jgi:hypothetical protein
MLGPHDRENAELNEVGLASERVDDPPEFFGRKAMFGDGLRSEAGSVEYVHGGALAGCPAQA